MTVTYQKVPITLSPFAAIPAGARPSSGLDDEDAEYVRSRSEEWAASTGVQVTVGSRGTPFEVEVVLNPAQDFKEGYAIDWDWGTGQVETGHDFIQRHTYAGAGTYQISAIVRQPREASYALYMHVTFDSDGAVVY